MTSAANQDINIRRRDVNGNGNANEEDANLYDETEEINIRDGDDGFDDDISDSQSDNSTKVKSRRPPDNAFRQQRLKAYHPILTPKTVIPILLVIAIIFIPLGAGMLYGSNKVQELVIDYTFCENLQKVDYFQEIPEEYYNFQLKNDITIKPQWKYSLNTSETDTVEQGLCHIQFQIPDDIGPNVYLFYRLKNFFANHRRFVTSFSEDQLNGKAASLSDIKDTVGQNCNPLSQLHGKRIYPCGLIANSLFNDTFTQPEAVNNTKTDFTMTNKGIAWENNKPRFKKTKYSADEVVPPPNWIKKFPNGYTEDNMPDISAWPEFQNWMYASALPLFSKMVLRNDDEVMSAGTYQITVGLHFPVQEYDGRKSIYLSTRSVIGGKNPFLGIAWIVGGGICLLLSVIFLVVNMINPRKQGDLSLLSWNKQEEK